MRIPSTLVCSLLLSVAGSLAQGTFQNLDFESATIIPSSPSLVQFGPAFPGWTGYVGTHQLSSTDGVLYDTVNLGSSAISIIDQGWTNSFGGPIDGTFTAVLQAGLLGGSTNYGSTTLSQTGTIPANAQSLRFKADVLGSAPAGQTALVVTTGRATACAHAASFWKQLPNPGSRHQGLACPDH
jgi:hypothetical protein